MGTQELREAVKENWVGRSPHPSCPGLTCRHFECNAKLSYSGRAYQPQNQKLPDSLFQGEGCTSPIRLRGVPTTISFTSSCWDFVASNLTAYEERCPKPGRQKTKLGEASICQKGCQHKPIHSFDIY